MKKNLIIVALTLCTFASLGVAYYERQEAEAQRLIALENKVLAEEMRMLAKVNEQKAMQAKIEADHQRALAMANYDEAQRQRIIAESERRK